MLFVENPGADCRPAPAPQLMLSEHRPGGCHAARLPHPVSHSAKIALPCPRLKSLSGGVRIATSMDSAATMPDSTPSESLAGYESLCQSEPRLRYPVGGTNHCNVVVFELPKLWTQLATMNCHIHRPYMSHSQGEEFESKLVKITAPTYSLN